MGAAAKLGLTVHHQTDHVFDTFSKKRMRYLTGSKSVRSDDSQSQPVTSANVTVNNGILRIDIEEGRDIHIELPVL